VGSLYVGQNRCGEFLTRTMRLGRTLRRLVAVGGCLLCLSCEAGGQRQQEATGVQRDGHSAQEIAGRHPADFTEVLSPAPPFDQPAEEFKDTTEVTEQQRPSLDPITLGAVRGASHEDFDRVVFVFRDKAIPGYHVAYATTPAAHCGSGETVPISGEYQLTVRLSPAQAHTETGDVTVREQTQHLNLQIVRELKLICDFEGEVTWVLGLSARKPYRVYELTDPVRLVVDIQH
jgi:hypothetical protein